MSALDLYLDPEPRPASGPGSGALGKDLNENRRKKKKSIWKKCQKQDYLGLGDPVFGQLYDGEVTAADGLLDLVEAHPQGAPQLTLDTEYILYYCKYAFSEIHIIS